MRGVSKDGLRTLFSPSFETRAKSALLRMTTVYASNHHRRVRQFIPPGPLRGKVRRQLPRHGFDSPEHAAFEVSRSEFSFHLDADLLPGRKAYLLVDATVGDNLEVAVGQQQIDQHAVIMGGIPDS